MQAIASSTAGNALVHRRLGRFGDQMPWTCPRDGRDEARVDMRVELAELLRMTTEA